MYTIYMIWLTQRGCRISNLRFVTPCIIVQFKINHQPDATIFQFIILTFIYSSKYFGRSPEAATTVIELLMMGGKTHETCWAVNKLENCCIWFAIYLNCLTSKFNHDIITGTYSFLTITQPDDDQLIKSKHVIDHCAIQVLILVLLDCPFFPYIFPSFMSRRV